MRTLRYVFPLGILAVLAFAVVDQWVPPAVPTFPPLASATRTGWIGDPHVRTGGIGDPPMTAATPASPPMPSTSLTGALAPMPAPSQMAPIAALAGWTYVETVHGWQIYCRRDIRTNQVQCLAVSLPLVVVLSEPHAGVGIILAGLVERQPLEPCLLRFNDAPVLTDDDCVWSGTLAGAMVTDMVRGGTVRTRYMANATRQPQDSVVPLTGFGQVWGALNVAYSAHRFWGS